MFLVKRFCILFFFIVVSFLVNASKYSDSLAAFSYKQIPDTQYISVQVKLSRYYLDSIFVPDSASNHINLALSRSKNIKDRYYSLFAQINYAYYLLWISEYDNSKKKLLEIIKKFRNEDSPILKAKSCLNLGLCYYYFGKYDSSNFYYDIALSKLIYVSPTPNSLLSSLYQNKMNNCIDMGHYAKAIVYANKGLEYARTISNKDYQTGFYNGLGIIYNNIGDQPSALENYYNSLTIAERFKDSSQIAMAKHNMANVYSEMGKFTNAERTFKEAKKIFALEGSVENSLGSDLGIAGVYSNTKQYTRAISLLDSIVIILENTNKHPLVLRQAYTQLAYIYTSQKKYAESEKWLLKSIELAKDVSNLYTCISIVDLASVYINMGRMEDAQSKLLIASHFEELKQQKTTFAEFNRLNAKIYSSKKDYRTAYSYINRYINLIDSIEIMKNSASVDSIRLSYIDKKHSTEVKLLEKEKEIQETNLKKEKNYRILFSLIGALILLFAIFLFRSNLQRKKANILLSEQKDELARQKLLVDEKNKDITDSIQYAYRIQKALLISDNYLKQVLKEYFTFYLPRDIVSGDFYWAFKDEAGKIYIAVADCTGHGVPGAFMSMLGMAYLNEIVVERKITKPNEVLNTLRNEIITSLNQEESKEESRDGMDMAFICIDYKNMTLEYSGANNPLIIISGNERRDVKANKFPVGKHTGDLIPFTLHRTELKQGDMIYLFSDGYADQFGGAHGKKYQVAQLKELLLSASIKPVAEQKILFEKEFQTWKGQQAQLDDVLLFGMKIT